jgi:hypothetical protein
VRRLPKLGRHATTDRGGMRRSSGTGVRKAGCAPSRALQAGPGLLLFDIVDLFAPTCLSAAADAPAGPIANNQWQIMAKSKSGTITALCRPSVSPRVSSD